ncbi:MAG: amino acid ABC transporter permease [Neisseriaceae bacterium]|nr:amino acid ABC transporter permease [Neisseriaceae bacterium]
MQNLGIEVLFNLNHLSRLADGLWVTLKVALIAIAISCVVGTLFGVIRTSQSVLIKWVFRLYLECFRIIPVLVWLYLLYYVLSADFDINLDAYLVSIIVFSLWGAAEMSDIVRGALIALPKHQSESGMAIGLNRPQLFRYVLLPQAVAHVLPAAINLSARMIMTTSLLFTLGVVEVIKVGQQIIESASFSNPMASVWVYGFIFFLYFIVCYPLAKIAQRLTQKQAQESAA